VRAARFRPRRSLAVALSIAWLGAGCGGPSDEPRSPPNLVLVSIDTLRADHLGTYGYPWPTTPAIDRLARDGVLFRTFVSHSPSTLPAHASLLTSLLPHHHSASVPKGLMVSPRVPTLAEVLREAGYATASFNGGIQLDASFGLDRGFDTYESSRSAEDRPETLVGPETKLSHAVRRGMEWIESVDGPFFVFLHSYEIHHPYTPDPRWLDVFESDYRGLVPDSVSVQLLKQINRGARPVTWADIRHIAATYDAELRSSDRALRDLVAFLKERSLWDDTIVVLVSDHGEEFAERKSVGWHSHTLFDELLLVPAVVKFPTSAHAGRIVREQVRGIDLAPTLVAALELEAPPQFSGRDLGPLVARQPASDLPAVGRRDKKSDPDSLGIRTGRWKLHNEQLFDLARDPRETVNVAAQLPHVVEELSTRHREIVESRAPAATVGTDTPAEVIEQLRALGYVD
jgi:arylsulfatase A-like enzyme